MKIVLTYVSCGQKSETVLANGDRHKEAYTEEAVENIIQQNWARGQQITVHNASCCPGSIMHAGPGVGGRRATTVTLASTTEMRTSKQLAEPTPHVRDRSRPIRIPAPTTAPRRSPPPAHELEWSITLAVTDHGNAMGSSLSSELQAPSTDHPTNQQPSTCAPDPGFEYAGSLQLDHHRTDPRRNPGFGLGHLLGHGHMRAVNANAHAPAPTIARVRRASPLHFPAHRGGIDLAPGFIAQETCT
jgi:hypothetical protein